MDGNGRWAKARSMPRIEGHRRGMQSLRELIANTRKRGIAHLSVFAFSSENWNRPIEEIDALMRFFVLGLKSEAKPLLEAGVRLRVVGDISAFAPDLQEAIDEAQRTTQPASAMTFNLCANYSGRWDIVQAARALQREAIEITSESLESRLGMAQSGPVDLLIRTGGEQRISNYILWQSAYAELFFTETLWPDFAAHDLEQALFWYAGRHRRFGYTEEQIGSGVEVKTR